MNPHLQQLKPYPFERLSVLMKGIEAPRSIKPITLTIGEPKHAPPEVALKTWNQVSSGLSLYPTTIGTAAFRQTIVDWLSRRFHLTQAMDAETMVLPINGTREGLFAIAQVLVDATSPKRRVLMPNPFYQIYEGAALLAGAIPTLLDLHQDQDFQPNYAEIPEHIWQETAFVYVCSPNNPTGSVVSEAQWKYLLDKAQEFNFTLIADECYSEIYPNDDAPPVGLLQVAQHHGKYPYERALVFHSLSKRSSLPGLRSGFVAGDATLIDAFKRYRTYHGCALPVQVQQISMAAWNDEAHVQDNRQAYRDKFNAVIPILAPVLNLQAPEAAFYLWPQLPMDDERFTQQLYAHSGVAILPGRYLGRPNPTHNPGERYARISLVAPVAECIEAAHRIRRFMESL
jgi:N-succinyldiaminopimelate aminotransferase